MDSYSIIEFLSASPVTTISTLILLFLGVLYFLLKDRDLPPGPTGLPIVGYWPYLTENVHIKLSELQKKYGEVFSITLAGKLLINLGSIKCIREAQITKSDCFAEKDTGYSVIKVLFDKSILANSGEEWKVMRKFFIQAFREYGLTSVKDYMAGPIYDSVNATVDCLKATNGTPFNIVPILNDRSAGIFRRMVFNDDEITPEELSNILESYHNVLVVFTAKNMLLAGEFARYFIFPKVKGFKTALENHEKMKESFQKLIRKHEKSYREDNIRDIIDSYIQERNARRKRGDPSAEYFSEEALISNLIQIAGDSVLSVAIFISFFIRDLLEYPEEQEKIYNEIQEVVGPDRQITLEDRKNLVYTNAFIQEVMRTTHMIPVLASLTCTKETTLNGYRIPKGAILMLNLWSAHRDPEVFEEAEKFKPSRYLSEPGKPKTDPPLTFGVGKRACAGEAFTMIQVFLFLTTIIRNFRLERPKGYIKESSFADGSMEVCVHPRK